MRKYLYNVISAMCVICAFASCGDFLEAENKAGIDAEGYFGTEEGIVALRAVMYNGMKSIVNNTDVTEHGTDLYVKSRGGSATDATEMGQYNIVAENGTISSFYQSVYAMINDANCMIKYGADNARFVAEAKFIRAYGYYMLIQQFGSVPYVTAYIETATKSYPRTPIADIYGSTIADLEEIMNDTNLPETDHNGNVSRKAVKALLAKVCLAAGWDLETTLVDAVQGTYNVTGTSFFDKAARYADEVIGNQQLTMSFEEKWSPYNEGNEEEIFSVQYDRDKYPGDVISGGHNRQGTYGSLMGNPTENGMKASGSDLAPSAKSIYLWEKGDERLDATFMMTTYNYYGNWLNEGYFAYYHRTAAERANMAIADCYFPWYVSLDEVEQFISAHKAQLTRNGGALSVQVHVLADPAALYAISQTGTISTSYKNESYQDYLRGQHGSAVVPSVKKFDDPNTPQQNNSTGYRDIVVLHLSDIYLTAAEAYLMSGNTTRSLQLINAVRSRAKASQLDSFESYDPDYGRDINFNITSLDLLLDERARELYAETTRWMDLRRTRQLVRYNIAFNPAISSAEDMSNVYGEIKWYRPIPAAEIETNTAISQEDQNPGY